MCLIFHTILQNMHHIFCVAVAKWQCTLCGDPDLGHILHLLRW